MTPRKMTRRDFVAGSAMAAAGAMIVPRHVLGGPGYVAPSDRLDIAVVGAGGVGIHKVEAMVGENIVALCDVDFAYVDRQIDSRQRDGEGKPREVGARMKEAVAGSARWADYREMLARQPDIDAIVIATPDHTHAVIAEAAMRAGKHVYVEKPLAATVQETRRLRATARETGVVTQMGNQGHSGADARRINELVRSGLIGRIADVHVWTNRPIWPQGLPRPLAPDAEIGTEPPTGWNRSAVDRRTAVAFAGPHPPPEGLDWDLFLGPVPEVPYHPIYHPFNWRGWVDFGVGALGDMGPHLIDHPYWALGLTYPSSVDATSSPWGGPESEPASYPRAMMAHFEFPGHEGRPPVRMHWYDGGLMPPRPEAMPDDVELNRTGGVIYVGEEGILVHETYGNHPKLFPESLEAAAADVPETYPRVDDTHEMNWVNACKGKAEATTPFEYAAPLTECMLLGLVALRAGQGVRIRYDGEAMRVTNVESANRFLTREYRAGWGMPVA